MTRESGKKREQIQLMSLDDLVPQDHLVRKLEAALDWNFIYELLEEIQKDRERHGKKPLKEAKIKQDDGQEPPKSSGSGKASRNTSKKKQARQKKEKHKKVST